MKLGLTQFLVAYDSADFADGQADEFRANHFHWTGDFSQVLFQRSTTTRSLLPLPGVVSGSHDTCKWTYSHEVYSHAIGKRCNEEHGLELYNCSSK